MGFIGKCSIFLQFRAQRQSLSSIYCPRRLVSGKRDEKQEIDESMLKEHIVKDNSMEQPDKIIKKKVVVDNSGDNFKYCMDRVKEADYINYLATLLMPREAIPHVFAILALNVELATLRNTIARNTGTADINKLAFWKDTIDSVFGIKKCPIPRQPTAQALKQFLKSETTIEYLHDMITARQKTLGDRPFKTMADLEDYGAKTNGSVIKIMCEGLNEYDRKLSENSINAADSMGKAVTIVNHIRSIVPLLKRGIVLLPQDIMTLNEYSGDKLYNGKEIDKACLVVRELSRVAEFHLREARQVKDFVHQKQRLAFLGASLACDYHLEGLKKNNFMFNYGELQKNDPFVAMKLAKMRLFRSY